MAIAQHTAAIGRVYLDRLRNGRKLEWRTGQKISDNGLHVAVRQPTPGHKRGEPFRQFGSGIANYFIFNVISGHGNSLLGEKLVASAVREMFGAARGDRTLDILCHRQAFCH